MSKQMVLKPRMSEKTYGLYQTGNTYVFLVPSNANKLTVAEAVQDQFNVSVISVRVLNEKGKTKQSYKKKFRPLSGKRSDSKKAYVKVKQGDNIPVFAAVEEAEKKAAKEEAKAKKKGEDK